MFHATDEPPLWRLKIGKNIGSDSSANFCQITTTLKQAKHRYRLKNTENENRILFETVQKYRVTKRTEVSAMKSAGRKWNAGWGEKNEEKIAEI